MTKQELLQTAKPILFNTEMVRAILGGKKTVTRRVIKPQPVVEATKVERFIDWLGAYRFGNMHSSAVCDRVPQYKVGDILYVRETWGTYEDQWIDAGYFVYRADHPDGATIYLFDDKTICDLPKWRPSIHMPKEAARIFLRVTNVRVERLQDIITGDYRTPLNINAEGLYEACCKCKYFNGDCKDIIVNGCCRLLEKWIGVWDSTIKKQDIDKYSWNANPWVWAYEFERMFYNA